MQTIWINSSIGKEKQVAGIEGEIERNMNSGKHTEKITNMICPEIHYTETSRGIMITGCYGYVEKVILPDEIDGIKVTNLAPYTFAADREDVGEKIWYNPETKETLNIEPGQKKEKLPRIAGTRLEDIWLPEYLTEVGRYAFYRCRNMQKIRLSNRLLDMGGGALTGCRLAEVEIDFEDGKKSCLKSIAEEMRYQLRVKLNYYGMNGERNVSGILFPEHYEEAVENTPARILETHHHGAGGYYRQCFYNRELDYRKYDEMFYHTVAEDTEETAVELALNRLRYPIELSEQARIVYTRYITAHMNAAAGWIVRKEDIEAIRFLEEEKLWTEEALQEGMNLAGENGKTEMFGILMDVRKQLFEKKKKTFEL